MVKGGKHSSKFTMKNARDREGDSDTIGGGGGGSDRDGLCGRKESVDTNVRRAT